MTQAAVAFPQLDHEPVHYPESDGKPMAETDDHRDEMNELIGALRRFYAERDNVYVSGNLLLYYEEGNPKKRCAPDVFVVLGVEKKQRRNYLLWEEKVPPTLVVEVTSTETENEDLEEKRPLYAELGVDLFFLYDPLAEYLDPPLQGFRRVGKSFQTMAPRGGPFPCPEMGLDLLLDDDGRLQLVDQSTGKVVPRLEALEREIAARRRAEARLKEFEAEIERLRSLNPGER